MRKNMIQWLVSFCSLLVFSMLAIVLRWQRFEQTYSLEDGKSAGGASNSYSRNMLMKAMAIFYFKSKVELLFNEYQQTSFLQLEYESLLYKITDFRLDVLVPDFTDTSISRIAKSRTPEIRCGHLLLANGKRMAVEFEFTSHARDAIRVRNSPFISCPSDTQPTPQHMFLQSSPLKGLRPIEHQLPQTAEECLVFQQVFRYLLDISDLRKKKYLTIKKTHMNVSEIKKVS